MMDIEDINRKTKNVEHLYLREKNERYTDPNLIELVTNLASRQYKNKNEYTKYYKKLIKASDIDYNPRGGDINYVYRKLLYNGSILDNYSNIQDFIVKKEMRSQSGILQVAILTSPWSMSGGKNKKENDGCDYNCYFCPKQKGMPRSYIRNEPAVKRAEMNNFSGKHQTWERLSTYDLNGHHIDKIEGIILGGTWSSYDKEYQREFIRDFYYACNVYFDIEKRDPLTLFEEIYINENEALCKIVGLTLETRPDCIDRFEIERFLSFGVTRVQLGIQTIDENILKKINRGCGNKEAIEAIRLLKEAGLKVLIHLMPNLPGSTPENDKETFERVFNFNNSNPNGDFIPDEVKIYPTSITQTSENDDTDVVTVIEKWYNEGKYVPYSNDELFQLLLWVKERMPSYIRITRIFRDIPKYNICGGADEPNMRERLQKQMTKPCKCIRCREVKGRVVDKKDIKLNYRTFVSSGSTEMFLSYESKFGWDKLLHGFLRLRLPKVQYSAYVRELHVYGNLAPTYKKSESNNQHKGYGSKLLWCSEWIAYIFGYKKILINSGVGVRNYYKKKGYVLNGEGYMEKRFKIDLYTFMTLMFEIILLIIYWLYIGFNNQYSNWNYNSNITG
jgi:ELP3 family radical SAM enzyme/protein acetyltransferase